MRRDSRQTEPDYFPCRYGDCGLTFRGPPAPLSQPYIAVLGGSDVYGPSVEEPFAEQLGDRCFNTVVNLGVLNGGPDVFARDPSLLAVAGGAHVSIIQILGAQNLSNRFYRVHPKRNDRFVGQSAALSRLYPDVDFSAFSFTRHMLITLRSTCPARFAEVVDELRIAWQARMAELCAALPGRRIFLSIDDRRDRGLGPSPIFVTDAMIDALRQPSNLVVRCDVTDVRGHDHCEKGDPPDVGATTESDTLTPEAHRLITTALVEAMASRSGLAA